MICRARRLPKEFQTTRIAGNGQLFELVPAKPGFINCIWGVLVGCGTENTITFNDGTEPVSGPIPVGLLNVQPLNGEDAPMTFPFIESSSGNALTLSVGATADVGGICWWSQVPVPDTTFSPSRPDQQ